MLIETYVEISQHVEVSIDVDTIAECIAGSGEKTKPAMFIAINNFFHFMEALPDEVISEVNQDQAKLITDFLNKQLLRFNPTQGE